MKITSIRVEKKINLGNYESALFSAEAFIEENEDANKSAETLQSYVEWHINKPLRDEKKKRLEKELEQEETTDDRKVKIKEWLKTYKEAEKKVKL